jgi:predicted Zn-dependent protease with MMP-like domain
VVVEEQDPYDEGLLGLYEGIPLSDRGIDYAGVLPDRISIFVDSHLAMGLDRAGTAEQIRRTVLHEIAHHLGIGDRRLHELGWG